MMKAINPATGETIKTYEEMSLQQVTGIIEQTHQAFLNWRRTSFAERSNLMKKAAQT
ncbi:MAG: aldehyde dehydrogenase family protein, partial [bacterium]